MAIVEIRKGEYVDTDPVEHEPGCVRMEPDSAAFESYFLPRLKDLRDEASKEVLANVRDGMYIGTAIALAIESLPASKTQRLRKWVEEARATRIYAYVEFRGLSRLAYGLMMTTGGPRDRVLASEEIGGYESVEGIAPYWYFRNAITEIGKKYVFEENPFVEVDDEDDYNEVLEAMSISKEDGGWEKPGLYDFRESPPSYSGTVEAYEQESMKYEAERALEDLFENDEWETACKTLLEDE
jgi:hypothetical protein